MKKFIAILIMASAIGVNAFADTWAYAGGGALGLGATFLTLGLVNEDHPGYFIWPGVGFCVAGVVLIIVDILDKDPNSSAYNSNYSAKPPKNPILRHLRLSATGDSLYVGASFQLKEAVKSGKKNKRFFDALRQLDNIDVLRP
jgi:hypothetical protein